MGIVAVDICNTLADVNSELERFFRGLRHGLI